MSEPSEETKIYVPDLSSEGISESPVHSPLVFHRKPLYHFIKAKEPDVKCKQQQTKTDSSEFLSFMPLAAEKGESNRKKSSYSWNRITFFRSSRQHTLFQGLTVLDRKQPLGMWGPTLRHNWYQGGLLVFIRVVFQVLYHTAEIREYAMPLFFPHP